MTTTPSTRTRVGVFIWMVNKTGELQDVWDIYQATKSQDAAIAVGSKLSEIVAGIAAGIVVEGLSKMIQKTGLGRVFDSIRKNQSLDQYKADQRFLQAMSGYAAGEATDALIEWGRGYVNENQTLDPLFFFLDDLWSGQVKKELSNLFSHIKNETFRIVRYDPLALDLDGDNKVSTYVDSNLFGPLFDFDSDGYRTATGWVSGQDGLLVRDLNSNGTIDSGTELFGDQTVMRNGSIADTGFQALADLDVNADGLVDINDYAFSSLRIWQDSNQNGSTDAGEMKTLAELGITSLSVAHTSENADVAGGQRTGTGSFTRIDANGNTTSQVMQEFVFDADNINGSYVVPIAVPEELDDIPSIPGVGRMRSLREACALSPALTQLVRQLMEADTRAEQEQIMPALLQEWVKTSPSYSAQGIQAYAGGGVEDPNSANVIQLLPDESLPTPVPVDLSNDEIRAIRVAEAVLGLQAQTIIYWANQNTNVYHEAYTSFYEAVYRQLSYQTRLQSYIDSIVLDLDTQDAIVIDTSLAFAMFDQMHSINSDKARSELAEFLVYIKGAGLSDEGSLTGAELLRDWLTTDVVTAAQLAEIISIGVIYQDGSAHDAQPTSGDDVIIVKSTLSVGANIGGGAGMDALYGDVGDDTLGGGEGGDQLLGAGGNDSLWGGAGNDVLYGGIGDDELHGEVGSDRLFGGAGADNLISGDGDDTLSGGAGNDYLYGGNGEDIYVFGLGDGHDILNNYGHQQDAPKGALILGDGIAPDEIKMWRSGNYLCISIIGTTDRIDIAEYFEADATGAYTVKEIRFADGTVWSVDYVKATVLPVTSGDDDLYGFDTNNVLTGGSTNDRLYGYGGNDVLSGDIGNDFLDGGKGNDQLHGASGADYLTGGEGADILVGGSGADTLVDDDGDDIVDGGEGADTLNSYGTGNDTFRFGRGSGADILNNHDDAASRLDVVELGDGIVASDINVLRSGSTLILSINGTSDSFTVANFFADEGTSAARIDEVRFKDGTIWTVETLKAMSLQGTGGDDVLTGYGTDDTFSGSAGNDRLVGGAGHDQLSGGEGDDFLNGDAGNDMLLGDTGADTLDGGDGDDAMWGGSGMDALAGGSGNDTLDGGDGQDLLVGDAGDDLLDGGAGDDRLIGGQGNDQLRGGLGNDVMQGGAGDDQYHIALNSGADRITGLAASDSGVDRFVLSGITTSMLQDYKALGNDLYLFIGGSEGVIENTIVLEGFLWHNAPSHVIEFAGGATMTKANFAPNYWYGTTGDDVNPGSFAPDNLEGGSGNDTLSGGMGNDTLLGGEGDDTLHGNTGDDILDGGVGENLLYGDEGNDLFRTSGGQLYGGAGNDTYEFLTQYQTSSQQMYTSSQIAELAGEGTDTAVTNYYNFTLSGTSVENLVVKMLGYHWFSNNYAISYDRKIFGNDLDNTITIAGFASQNAGWRIAVDGGLGNDTLIGSVGDELYILDSTGDVVIEPENSTSMDTVRASFSYSLEGRTGIEVVELTANDTTATGNSGNNRLDGSLATGTNTLIGGAGDDTYIIDSNDIVVEQADGGTDTVLVKKFPQGAQFFVPSGQNNIEIYQLHENAGNGGLIGSDGDDILIGNRRSNGLSGGAGNDVLRSGGADYSDSDSLNGGEGDDLLISEGGNLVNLTGGLGNDALQVGVSDSETINYNLGDGDDLITMSSYGTGSGNCRISFGSDIDPDNVIWSRDGNDLLITFSDSAGDKLTVKDYWAQEEGVDVLTNVVDQFSFNGESSYRSGITLEALRNKPPTRNYSTLDATAPTGQAWIFTLPVDAFSDENPESLVYSVEDLPSWLTFDSSTRTFQGTPPMGQADQYYQVTATDIYGASAYLTLHFAFVNIIQGTSGNDSLVGTSGVDMLIGLAGNDTLNGGADADQLIGGEGNDTYTVDNGSDQVIEAFGEGDDLVNASDSYWLSENIERLTLTGSAIEGWGNELDNVITGNSSGNTLSGNEGNDTLTGNNGGDSLYGGSGNDTLDGGSGDDYMDGGEGDDTYIVGSTGDQVEEWELSGTDTVRSSVTYTLGYEVENLVLTGSSGLTGNGNELDNLVTGNSGANTLRGYAGNDTLDGGTGNDTMLGGAGNDTYVVNATGDVVTELAGEGTDLIQSAVTYTLGSNVENLTLTGTSAINGTGNTLNNVLVGNTGNNTLSGGTGADTLVGGAGTDTYVVDNTGDVVTELAGEGTDLVQAGVTYTLSSNVENLTLTGTNAINGTGNGLDNVITGNSGNNTLTGASGNDTLDGGTGNDTMLGGAGNDTYVVNATGDVVTELASEGTDLIRSAVTYTLGNNIENLTLTGTSAINATGNTLDNVLIGNSGNNTLTGGNGNDTLDGGVGNDTMVGGTGDDTYFVNVSSDVVTEQAGQGDDTVVSAITYTLSSNLEHLTLSGTTAINGTGNASNNRLTGNTGNNALSSAAGDDVLQGGAGTDTLTGGTGKDTYVMARGYGADTVVENDTASGQLDVARFLSGVSYDQLWFAKPSGSNNLEITIIGTGDVLIIKDWYLGSQYRVEEIRTADGSMLLTAAKVQDLVAAMASLTKPAIGQTTLSPAYQSQLAAVFASTWTSTGGQGLLAGGGSEPTLMTAKVAGTTVMSEDMTAGIMAGGCNPTPREDRLADWLARVGDRANDGRIQAWLADHGYASIDEWLESDARPETPHGELPDRFEDRRYLDAPVAMSPLENASVTSNHNRPGSPLAERVGGSALLFPESLADLLASFEEQQTTSTDRLYQSVLETLVQDRSPQWNGVLGEGQPDRSMQADAASSYQRLISAMSLAGVNQSSLGATVEGHRNEPSLM